MRNFLSTIILSFLPALIFGQSLHPFTLGLASGTAHRYGRDALYADTLASLIDNTAWKLPVQDLVWYQQGDLQKKWSAVQADSSGTFRSSDMNNGYLYCSYHAAKAMPATLTISGHSMVYVNGEAHAGDQYRYGWMHIPVALKKGINHFYIRTGGVGRFGGVKAQLNLSPKPIALSAADATVPSLVSGISDDFLWAGIVCLNHYGNAKKSLSVRVNVGELDMTTTLPELPAMSTRKMPVKLPVPNNFSGSQIKYLLTLYDNGRVLDTMTVPIDIVQKHQHQRYTFISEIDGSVQYYAVAPQVGGSGEKPALFFSVHGAEVEAINQARAYKLKPEGPLVAPTNRRPRGFNWEDWGRLDAMEVLQIAKKQYNPNPQKIYLTGHSMGGHGSWYLGATYAGQWAAIAPCAGYPTLATYGSADGLIPTESGLPIRKTLIRAGNPSNVMELVRNYAAAGVYIFHGDSDRTVSVNYARQMREELSKFHPDFVYKEYPGGSHWFGDISVDWPPIFSYFNQHVIPNSADVHHVDFSTASPAISAAHHWLTILQQEKSYAFSRVKLFRDTGRLSITGTTTNVQALQMVPDAFKASTTISIDLDGTKFSYTVQDKNKPIVLKKQNGKWTVGANPDPAHKGVNRNGGLKEAFNHRMVFVYGTQGNALENAWALQKAKYDAETWYYRGNGAVDVIADKDYTTQAYANRGVILYGNATTNSAYDILMTNCPVRIERGMAKVGQQSYAFDNIGAYFMYPSSQNNHTAVAVIGGTGLSGMRAANANQYFAGGSGFPDFMLFTADIGIQGEKALKASGFYNNDWSLGNDWHQQ